MKKAVSLFLIALIAIFCTSCLPENLNLNNESQQTSSKTTSTTDKNESVVLSSSSESSTKSTTPPALSAPILKAITPVDTTTFTIEWSETTGADGYILFVAEEDGDFSELARISSDETSYTHENLTNEITYSYKVQAYRNSGTTEEVSEDSNTVEQFCDNNLINFYTPYRSEEYVEYRGSDTFVMSGKHRNNSFTLSTGGSSKDLYADYNFDSKYSSIQFTYGFVDGAKGNKDIFGVTLKILGDDELIATYDVDNSQLAQTVKLDIKNVNKFELYVEKKDTWWGEFGFADIKLFK